MGTLKAAQNITLEGNNIVIESNKNDNGIQGINAAEDVYFVVNAGGSVQVGAVSGNDKTGYTIKTGEHQSGTIDNITYFKLVRTLDELQAINDDVNDYVSDNYMLAGDIDGSTSANFMPIGTEENQFAGRFNGLNYSINGLVINKPDDYAIGLFGSVGNGGIVEYVKRNGGRTTGAGSVGGIVGSSFGGTIRNVYNKSEVSASDGEVGGIVGYIQGAGSIENASNGGDISGKGGSLGDIVGHIEGSVVIEGSGITVLNVINKGNVTSEPDVTTEVTDIGGVIGWVSLHNNSANTFENLKNEGTVSHGSSAQGRSENVGGVFGTLGSDENAPNTVKNVKNEANVSGTKYVGGIVGNLGYITIENVKNEGTVNENGVESVDKIVGYKLDGSIIEGTYDNSWEAVTDIASTTFGPYTPLNTTSPSGGGSSSGGSTTPTSTDTDTSSGDDSSTDTDTTPTIPTTPTTPTVPLTPTTPTTPTAPTTPTSETTTPVEETTPQTPTVEPTVAPTSAETEPVAPVIEPKTEPVSPTVAPSATTTLEEVLQSVGKKQEGGNTYAENIT
ncbi:MAG: hypothetical protein J6I62_00495, partial [Selenomonadaceae bacterium]|nr:hypothetical protein [Selenomonadaceae bacterium]